MEPNEKISLRASIFLPSPCSGEMYATVPTIAPSSVLGAAALASLRFSKLTGRDLGQLGDAEIQHFDMTVFTNDDVGWLEIPVDDTR
jgi:hypothetical protein